MTPMRTRAARALLALGVLLAACVAASEGQGSPVVRAEAQGDGNVAQVTVTGRAVAIDLWSDSGIGSAVVPLAGGPAPESVELRLHLQGLEELRLSFGRQLIVASVASGPGHDVRQRRVGPDGAERDLKPDKPGWLAVAVVADEADPPFPLRDGYFAVTLPAEALIEGDGALTIAWIDFFR